MPAVARHLHSLLLINSCLIRQLEDLFNGAVFQTSSPLYRWYLASLVEDDDLQNQAVMPTTVVPNPRDFLGGRIFSSTSNLFPDLQAPESRILDQEPSPSAYQCCTIQSLPQYEGIAAFLRADSTRN